MRLNGMNIYDVTKVYSVRANNIFESASSEQHEIYASVNKLNGDSKFEEIRDTRCCKQPDKIHSMNQ